MRKGILFSITKHAANNGWEIFSSRLIQDPIQNKHLQQQYSYEALQFCTDVVRAEYLSRLLKAGVRSKEIIPTPNRALAGE